MNLDETGYRETYAGIRGKRVFKKLFPSSGGSPSSISPAATDGGLELSSQVTAWRRFTAFQLEETSYKLQYKRTRLQYSSHTVAYGPVMPRTIVIFNRVYIYKRLYLNC